MCAAQTCTEAVTLVNGFSLTILLAVTFGGVCIFLFIAVHAPWLFLLIAIALHTIIIETKRKRDTSSSLHERRARLYHERLH
jgi:hypothetical protein